MEKNHIFKLEKVAISKEKMVEKTPELFNTFGTETVNKNGDIVIENEKLKATMQYENLIFDIDVIPRDEDAFIGSNLNVNERALIRFLNFHPEDYQKLSYFYIINKVTNEVIDLSKESAKNTIYVRKKGNDPEGSATHYLNTYIKLNIEPKTPAGILTLLHEIGHKKDPSIDPLEMMLVSLGKEKDEIVLQKEMVERERYAWAYSLTKLRPFFQGLNINIKDIDVFIHKWALGTYSSSIDPNIIKK